MTLKQVVEKTAHNPAKRYAIIDRGFIREGYFADLVLIDVNQPTEVTEDNTLYHCGWTPFINHQFSASINRTWVNGQQVYDGQTVIEQNLPSQRLAFNR
jgi:dihydroorotase